MLVEKLKQQQQQKPRLESCDLHFFKTQNCPLNVFSVSPQEKWIEMNLLQIIHYRWQLLFIYTPLKKNRLLPHATWLVLVHVTSPKPQSMNCVMFF